MSWRQADRMAGATYYTGEPLLAWVCNRPSINSTAPRNCATGPVEHILEALPCHTLAAIWGVNKDTAARIKREPYLSLCQWDDPRTEDNYLSERRIRQLRVWLEGQS